MITAQTKKKKTLITSANFIQIYLTILINKKMQILLRQFNVNDVAFIMKKIKLFIKKKEIIWNYYYLILNLIF